MQRTTGIKLPQTLLEQIQGDPSGRGGHGHARKPKLSRKEARKQDRAEKKQRKASYFTTHTPPVSPTGAKRPATPSHEHLDLPARKKARLAQRDSQQSVSAKPALDSKSVVSSDQKSTVAKPSKRKQSALQKLANRTTMSVPRSQAERDEDARIAYLESKLGMGKGSKKGGGGFEDDGLDDLLDGLDSIVSPGPSAMESVSESSDEEDEELQDESTDVGEDADSTLEWTGFVSEDEENSSLNEDAHEVSAPLPSSAPAAGRYVPPHLRNKTASADETEALAKLTRQLKGLLNRMSEQNIASILDEIEELYRNNRRHDMTETLMTLLVSGITSHSSMLDSFVILNAALISALHKIIGVDFAAFIVQNIVAKYEEYYSTLSASEEAADAHNEVQGKECSNLIILLSELYNFQVVSSVLMYDIIRSLLDGNLSETDIELLLKLLRNSGQQLRQDDPTALKDIIQIVQTKVGANESSSSSRMRFMVETLINLKNNKTKQRAAAQHTSGDSVERLKKFLTGLGKKRHLMAHDPLRVSLADLHSADSRGKWWLVGAAWGGDPLVEHQAKQQPQAESTSATFAESALLKLAKKQGMNTDIRRSIFVVLMSSDDYMDACERLAQLNLSEVQQREIVRVILHCCGNEKSYNPYYTLVGQHLASSSHSHKITLQFCLWDFLRDLGETSVGGAELIKSLGEDYFGGDDKISPSRRRNVARAYAWWIARDAVSLTVLKPVDFIALKPTTRRFMRDLLERVLSDTQARSPALAARVQELPPKRERTAIETVFLKAARVPALAAGLAYFLAEMDKARSEESDEDAFYKWAGGVAVETLRMGADIVSSL